MVRRNRMYMAVVILLAVGFFLAQAPGVATASKKVVKIGFIGPLTGPNASAGVGARNSFDLAIRQANASKAYPYKIEAVWGDDASTPSQGVSAAMRIAADPEVVAASGHWNSPVAEATIPTFKQAGIPFVIWGAIGPDLTCKANYPIVTRVCPTSVQENMPLAKFAMDKLHIKKWAIISDTTVYGKDNTAAWKAEASKSHGAKIVSVDEIQVGQTDFRPVLTKIKTLHPKAIYFGGVVMEGALIRRQMQELGMKLPLFAISGIASDQFVQVAGNSAEGVVATKPGESLDQLPGGQRFEKAYAEAGYKEPYGAYGPYAYDAAGVILAALKKVGPNRQKLIPAIANIKYKGLLGTTTFNSVGQTTNSLATVLVVQDGKWVPWKDSKYASGKSVLPDM